MSSPSESSPAALPLLGRLQTIATEALAEGTPSPELEQRADEFVKALLTDPAALSASGKARETSGIVGQLGYSLQAEALRQSEMLKVPLQRLGKEGEGGAVAKSLTDLKIQVEALDPGKLNLAAGWFSRIVGKLPGVGTPLKRYFTQFESAQSVIASILKTLESGKGQLQRDNITLVEDQKRMRALTSQLEAAVQFGQLLDEKLQYALEREITPESETARFVGEELLFPLRQRILDLQQQLAVNQQGILATELIIRNNAELVRGVDRSLSVTVTALHVGVTVALALENQRIVLDHVEAIGKTTSDLIAGTSRRLKTQGVAIQQRAASSTLQIDSLRSAFADLRTALDDVSAFRQKALPAMTQQIQALDELSTQARVTLNRMDEGNRARPVISLTPPDTPLKLS